MRYLFSCCLVFSMANLFAQKETYDLATYTIPNGWKKVSGTAEVTGFAITNNQNGTYCQIAIYKSMNTMGNSQLDFETEWQDLVAKPYKVTANPESGPSTTEDGWEAKSGVAPYDFNGVKSIAMLVTMSGYGKRMSIVILTNTQDFQTDVDSFLESVILKKPELVSTPTPVNSDEKKFILGTWGANASDQSSWRVNNGVMSTISRQYTFNANGTYSFVSKAFDPLMDKILLGKENGDFQISGSNLTITPQKSVLEAWSKKDGTDQWGNLLTTQNITLEQTSYRFTRHYFEGIQKWNLVLQSDKETRRDGPFNGNTTFSNAWYYGPISNINPVIVLPGGSLPIVQQANNQPATLSKGFAFSTTNFDDGWSSTVQDDWIQVTKGNYKVLIHYPNKNADAYNSVLMDGLKNAWNILVAPKYSNATNFEFKPLSNWESIEFAEADAVEKTTGQTVHVVLFKKNYSGGGGKYMEFITSSKNAFEQEFGAYHEGSSGWEKTENMVTYNKFAVAAADLTGKWSNDFSGAIQYVNAYSGADAGMATHASNENFEFGPGDAYRWDLGVASGNVGNIKFQSVKSSGKFSMSGNWQVNFSDIEGKPRTLGIYFSCVRGTRILWLDNKAFAKIQ